MQRVDWLQESPLDRRLPALADAIEQALRPATYEQASAALRKVVVLLRCKPPDEEQTQGYIAVMTQYPWDLLSRSLLEAVSVQEWHALPTPGALVKVAREETAVRARKLSQVKIAMSRLDLARKLRATRPPAVLQAQ